jgi:hypothetical protein
VANFLRGWWDPSVWQQGRLRKQQALGKTECALRVLSGTQPGLGSKWKSGHAALDPGSLEFLPTVGGSVIARPGQEWLHITVIEATRAYERRAKGREIWMVNPSLPIVLIRTPDAELEWAISQTLRDWALDRVNAKSGA